MTRGSVSLRLITGALVAAGFLAGGALISAAPASAQETPWYMPQPWVYPPQTGPKIRKLPGEYGHNSMYSSGTYGSFGNGCYGNCRHLPGMVTTSSGVVLQQPVIAIFDPRDFQVVPTAQGRYAQYAQGQYAQSQYAPGPYAQGQYMSGAYQAVDQPGAPAPAGASERAAKPVQPLVVPVNVAYKRAQQSSTKFTTQHGVRIIRPAPVTGY